MDTQHELKNVIVVTAAWNELTSDLDAEALNLGMTTVDTYRTRIKDKLGLANGTELMKVASRWVLEGV